MADLELRAWVLDFFEIECFDDLSSQDVSKAMMVLQQLVNEVTQMQSELARCLDKDRPPEDPNVVPADLLRAKVLQLLEDGYLIPTRECCETLEVVRGLMAEIDELHAQLEFWLGEGDTEWPPEMPEYRGLASILPKDRTPEQTLRLRELARLVKWKSDACLQYARAELCEANRPVELRGRPVTTWMVADDKVEHAPDLDAIVSLIGRARAQVHPEVIRPETIEVMHSVEQNVIAWLVAYIPIELLQAAFVHSNRLVVGS